MFKTGLAQPNVLPFVFKDREHRIYKRFRPPVKSERHSHLHRSAAAYRNPLHGALHHGLLPAPGPKRTYGAGVATKIFSNLSIFCWEMFRQHVYRPQSLLSRRPLPCCLRTPSPSAYSARRSCSHTAQGPHVEAGEPIRLLKETCIKFHSASSHGSTRTPPLRSLVDHRRFHIAVVNEEICDAEP